MRVGVVIEKFDPAQGGMEEWCRQFVIAAAGRVDQITIVAQQFGNVQLPPNVERHVVPQTKSRIRFSEAVERCLRGLELDIVHDMGAGWHCDILQPHGGSHLAWLARGPELYPPWQWWTKRIVDGLSPRHRDAAEHCQRQFAVSASSDRRFIALCNLAADDFVRFHNVRPEQIDIIYNGVDCGRYSPDNRTAHRQQARQKLGVREETLVLLLATHSFRRKGLGELLTVAGKLAANGRDLHLVVAGRGRLAKWRAVAARLRLSDRVSFIGGVSDMIPCFAAADVYVHPTYFDQCSLVILEAAACGLPIVTTRRNNGTAELFREGQEIFTINSPRDLDGFYQCLEAMFDERTRLRLGVAARAVAVRNPFERNVAEILRLYERQLPRRLAA